MFKSYINPNENKEANRQLPRLMVEGLLLGGTGLGVLALIFEIAADAFSVAAYQTLLAIHGAEGNHQTCHLRLHCPLCPALFRHRARLQSRSLSTPQMLGAAAPW